MSMTVVDKLHFVRGEVQPALHPAIDHAIALAKEAEHEADSPGAMQFRNGYYPSYPPLVTLLADAADSLP